ncbi:hypothetical protein E2C01_041801 [Portunus trituberculatus]|uniref:Uncharacterized protein n=1 Tax=Portunus trituberculatus TaxID=210409 RepID=A0A5B7FRC3_PORTR|nr:hypothetical protein [Portunus trituberculatus]
MMVLAVGHPPLKCREVCPWGQQEREQCTVMLIGAYRVYQQQGRIGSDGNLVATITLYQVERCL